MKNEEVDRQMNKHLCTALSFLLIWIKNDTAKHLREWQKHQFPHTCSNNTSWAHAARVQWPESRSNYNVWTRATRATAILANVTRGDRGNKNVRDGGVPVLVASFTAHRALTQSRWYWLVRMSTPPAGWIHCLVQMITLRCNSPTFYAVSSSVRRV